MVTSVVNSNRTSNEALRSQEQASITVAARIRPLLRSEAKHPDCVQVGPDEKTITVSDGKERKRYTVDCVIDSRDKEVGSQAAIFDTIGKRLVSLSLQGYNVCLFAYGHTGSGKTYTMLGDGSGYVPNVAGDGAGLLPRFLHELFNVHAQMRHMEEPRYTCEFYEVYNEQIRDLLMPDGAQRKRSVHVHPQHGVRIDGLSESVIRGVEDAMELVRFGNQMRTVSSTTMNERSSRSHAVFTFRSSSISPKQDDGQASSHCDSAVTFVDLAGREAQEKSNNQAAQWREMCHINTSLFQLAFLITKIADGKVQKGSLRECRNSKLTLVLAPALLGNSQTALVATVAPLQDFFNDTVSTLGFAQSVKKIKTTPVVNDKTKQAVVSELEAEVKSLQERLKKSTSHASDREHDLIAAQAMIAQYKRSWEEAVLKSEEHRKNRLKMSVKLGVMAFQSSTQNRSALRKDRNIPFITKLTDDPSLQGCCNWFLKADSPMFFGSDAERCDVVVNGIGITTMMCKVEMLPDDGSVMVSQVVSPSESTRVLVKGIPLSDSQDHMEIYHGDCIILGYAHGFRLVVPGTKHSPSMGDLDPTGVARSTVAHLDMASAVAEIEDESGEQFKAIFPYLQQLSGRVSQEAVSMFLVSLHRICPMVDEANMITREIFGNDGIAFELHALTEIFDADRDATDPVLCVLCVLQQKSSVAWTDSIRAAAPRNSNSMVLHHDLSRHMALGTENSILYVWTLEKFLKRLKAIREVYQDGCEAKDDFISLRKQLAQKPCTNPWQEMAFDDVKLLAEDPLHIYHRQLGDPDTSPPLRNPSVASGLHRTKKCDLKDNGSMAAVPVKWADMERVLASEVSKLRSLLGASAFWDASLQVHLRRWARRGGAAILPESHPKATGDAGLLSCGEVACEALLSSKARANGLSKYRHAFVWAYRFPDAESAIAHILAHPVFGTTDTEARGAAVSCEADVLQSAHNTLGTAKVVLVCILWQDGRRPSGASLLQIACENGNRRRDEVAVCQQKPETQEQQVAVPHLTLNLGDLGSMSPKSDQDCSASQQESPISDCSAPSARGGEHNAVSVSESAVSLIMRMPDKCSQPGRANIEGLVSKDLAKVERPGEEFEMEGPASKDLTEDGPLIERCRNAWSPTDLSKDLIEDGPLRERYRNAWSPKDRSKDLIEDGPLSERYRSALSPIDLWTTKMRHGVQAELLTAMGESISAHVSLSPNLSSIIVTLAGERRLVAFDDIQAVCTDEAAMRMLRGTVPEPLPSQVCVLKQKDGSLLAIRCQTPQEARELASHTVSLCSAVCWTTPSSQLNHACSTKQEDRCRATSKQDRFELVAPSTPAQRLRDSNQRPQASASREPIAASEPSLFYQPYQFAKATPCMVPVHARQISRSPTPQSRNSSLHHVRSQELRSFHPKANPVSSTASLCGVRVGHMQGPSCMPVRVARPTSPGDKRHRSSSPQVPARFNKMLVQSQSSISHTPMQSPTDAVDTHRAGSPQRQAPPACAGRWPSMMCAPVSVSNITSASTLAQVHAHNLPVSPVWTFPACTQMPKASPRLLAWSPGRQRPMPAQTPQAVRMSHTFLHASAHGQEGPRQISLERLAHRSSPHLSPQRSHPRCPTPSPRHAANFIRVRSPGRTTPAIPVSRDRETSRELRSLSRESGQARLPCCPTRLSGFDGQTGQLTPRGR